MSTRGEGAYRAPSSMPANSDDFPSAADPHTPPRPTQALGTSTGSAVEPPADQRVATDRAEERRDRVRWGPICAGAAVVLTVFIVLQLLFFALGLDREILKIFARSLETYPPGSFRLTPSAAGAIVHFGGEMFSVGLRLAPWVAGARRVAQRPLSAGRDGPLAERQIAAHVDDVVDDGNNTGHSRTQAMQVVQENSSSGWITPPSAPIIACRSTTGATRRWSH